MLIDIPVNSGELRNEEISQLYFMMAWAAQIPAKLTELKRIRRQSQDFRKGKPITGELGDQGVYRVYPGRSTRIECAGNFSGIFANSLRLGIESYFEIPYKVQFAELSYSPQPERDV